MQTEWPYERNDDHSEDAASVPATEPQIGGAAPAADPAPAGATTVVTEAADEEAPRFGADAPSLAEAGTDAAPEGEEQAHRSAVDAVDELLDEVEHALARLDDGTYGRCETCGVPIDDADLAEQPLVRRCTPCGIGAQVPATA